MFSIGGGYAIILLIQEKVVNQTGWISEKMFTDIIAICRKNNITISDLMVKVNREKSEMKKENGNEKNEE